MRKAALTTALLSYAVSNLVVMVLFATALPPEEFGRFSLYLAIANLLMALPGFGFGSVMLSTLLGDRSEARIGTANALIYVYVVLLLILGVIGVGLDICAAADCLCVVALSVSGTTFLVAEQVTKGTDGVAGLARQRLFAAVALVASSLALAETKNPDATTASAIRAIPLLAVGMGFGWNVMRVVALDRGLLGSVVLGALSFGVATLSTIGLYSADKILLKSKMSYEALGAYSALFLVTFMVANRCSDIYLSWRLGRSGSDNNRNLATDITEQSVLALCLAVGLALFAAIVDRAVLGYGFSWEAIIEFALGGALMFLSDTSWWKMTVWRRGEHAFAAAGVALVVLFGVAIFTIGAPSIETVGRILIAVFLVSLLLYAGTRRSVSRAKV
jgi:O-antigen/teichoic acid export membrane protein